MNEARCDECGEVTISPLIDHGYRKGDTEEEVERWVCRECDQAIYDEALSYID